MARLTTLLRRTLLWSRIVSSFLCWALLLLLFPGRACLWLLDDYGTPSGRTPFLDNYTSTLFHSCSRGRDGHHFSVASLALLLNAATLGRLQCSLLERFGSGGLLGLLVCGFLSFLSPFASLQGEYGGKTVRFRSINENFLAWEGQDGSRISLLLLRIAHLGFTSFVDCLGGCGLLLCFGLFGLNLFLFLNQIFQALPKLGFYDVLHSSHICIILKVLALFSSTDTVRNYFDFKSSKSGSPRNRQSFLLLLAAANACNSLVLK